MKKPYQKVELSGGSDGARTLDYDFSNLKLHERKEIVDLILLPSRKSEGRYSLPLTHIPQEQWVEVAKRHASGESLRALSRA